MRLLEHELKLKSLCVVFNILAKLWYNAEGHDNNQKWWYSFSKNKSPAILTHYILPNITYIILVLWIDKQNHDDFRLLNSYIRLGIKHAIRIFSQYPKKNSSNVYVM